MNLRKISKKNEKIVEILQEQQIVEHNGALLGILPKYFTRCNQTYCRVIKGKGLLKSPVTDQKG